MRESLRYLENVRELLSKSPVEDDTYTDIKYVQEAGGTAYLAVLKAIYEYLISKGDILIIFSLHYHRFTLKST